MFTGTNYSLITVTDFKAYAPEVDLSSFDDPTISGMIVEASQMVSDFLQYNPLAENITGEMKKAQITTEGDLLIWPNKVPVITLTSLAIRKGATTINIVLTDSSGNTKYNLDSNARVIRYPYGEITLVGLPIFANFYSLRGATFYSVISYRGGYEVSQLPGTIRQATILFMRDILAKRYNQAGANRIQQGGISMEFMHTNNPHAKIGESNLVTEAKRLLGTYRRIG